MSNTETKTVYLSDAYDGKSGDALNAAVDKAVDEMPDGFIIKPLIIANRAEVDIPLSECTCTGNFRHKCTGRPEYPGANI